MCYKSIQWWNSISFWYVCRYKGKNIFYKWKNLRLFIRFNLPLIGSHEIFVQGDNVVRIPRTMFVYMICFDETACNINDWAYTKYEGDFIGISHQYNGSHFFVTELEPQKIYRRILPAGKYTFNAEMAAYLFQDDTGIYVLLRDNWSVS